MDSAKIDNMVLQGIGVSAGIAIGQAKIADRARVAVVETAVKTHEIPLELERLKIALEKARTELQEIKETIAEKGGDEHLHHIDTHLLLLEDAMLIEETSALIEKEGINAEGALKRTLHRLKNFFNGIEDEYLRERGADVETVVDRVLRNMVGKKHEPLTGIDSKVIVVAHDLSPSDILQMDKTKVIGFITEMGGKTSHTSILARALEIPAVVGMERITGMVNENVTIIIDGFTGTVIVNPDQETFRDYLRRKQHYEYVERELLKLKDLPAVTLDGFSMHLKANMEIVEEVPSLRRHGAEGIGLYRTEMLFFNRESLPDEEEQFTAYARIISEMAPNPVTIRTLDVGGDKVLNDLNLGDEANPALGVRAIRLSLMQPQAFRTQLRAILRASAHGRARVFFPMISGIDEVRRAKAIVEEVKQELRNEFIPFDEDIPIGIMIEIPSAVIIADLLAREVDFFSVGTNDLIQYSLAIDRTNEHLSSLYEPLHPAVLRSLKMVVDAAHVAGIEACMCGEMAGDPEYLPILLGLGFDELSMNAVSIPRVKNILRRCTRKEAEAVAAQAMTYATAQEAESFLKSVIAARFSHSFD
jgi:phosphotransferase system enzyme I (PtsI)